jgi:protoporphyrinogen oxidase
LPTQLVVDVIKDFAAVHQSPMAARPNYAQWLYQAYGKTFAETFPMVYGRKYHTTTMDQLTTDWIGPRMYRPSLDEIVHGAIAGQRASVHYVDTFRYPSFGGFVSYLEAFAKRFELRLNHRVCGLRYFRHPYHVFLRRRHRLLARQPPAHVLAEQCAAGRRHHPGGGLLLGQV